MKKTYFILWFIISFFIFYSKVEAGVCNGLTNHKYCDSPFGDITFISGHTDSETGFSSSNGKYVREEYKAKLTDGGYTAFCLDPGTTVPTSSTLYKKVRELDISTPLDIGIYKMYQKFINDTQYRIQSNTYDSKIATLYRAHLQFGLRSWLVDKSVDFTVSAAYKDYANGFKECSGYMKNSNSKKDTYCFSDITNREAIKKYYESASKPYTWKNPFEKGKNIKQQIIEPTLENQKYTYRFIVNLKDFFENGLAVYNLNEASFKAYISINDNDCRIGTNCNNISSIKKTETIINLHNKDSILNNDEIIFGISFTEEELNNYFSNGGTITLHYSYEHPMNYENIFIARHDLTSDYQRMVVIKNYEHKGQSTITIGSISKKEYECSHTTEGYFDEYGTNLGNITNFLEKCDCGEINQDLLNEIELESYKNICENVDDEEYSTNIQTCSNQDYDNYYYNHKNSKTINNYCNIECEEDIQVKNLKGKYTVKAGEIFDLEKYPELIANKSCKVKVNYTTWKNDYYTALNEMVKHYNSWQKSLSASQNSRNGSCCWCPCTSRDEETGVCTGCTCVANTIYYDYSYQNYLANNINLSWTNDSGTLSYCGGHDFTDEITAAKNNFESELSKVNELKSKLKICNNYLYGENKNINDTTFYELESDLNYYYEQDYSKLGIIWNNERLDLTDNYYVDDSELSKKYRYEESGELKNSETLTPFTSSYNSFNFITSVNADSIKCNGNICGLDSENIKTNHQVDDYSIDRDVKYEIDYAPSVYKYVDSFEATITDEYSILNNPITIGYKYDIDISAKEKTDNNNYYDFVSLGDKSNISDYYKETDENKLQRWCTYEITNEILTTKDKTSMNLVFRIVDPNDIDPNGRWENNEYENADGTTNGFKNWRNQKGELVKAEIENTAKNNNTFNPDNLEYSFTLDSTKIKEIREEKNEISNYNDFYIECNSIAKTENVVDGAECISDFVTDYAQNTDGREKWKYLTYKESTMTWSIKEYNKKEMTNSLFKSLQEKLGGITP